MFIEGEKTEGLFIKRINRFEALVNINDKIELVHVPNTGRMEELLFEGAKVILLRKDSEYRKTKYSLLHIYKNNHLICINSLFANKVFEEGVLKGKINFIKGRIKREVTFLNSRFDFLITDGINDTLLEIKCATYEEDGIAKFPDAPTQRGRKHIEELIKANNNYKTGIIIISFIDYVKSFTPNYNIDRAFGEKLKEAYEKGVIVKAYRCNIDIDEIEIKDEIEIFF